MRREQLVSALHETPFQPFRLIQTNGRTHEVRHPELVLLMSGTAVVGYPDPTGQGGDRFAVVDLSHIMEIERPTPPAPPPNGAADSAG